MSELPAVSCVHSTNHDVATRELSGKDLSHCWLACSMLGLFRSVATVKVAAVSVASLKWIRISVTFIPGEGL
ncbi:hypothetical protein Poly51_48170 [Rubripirellula tenax]|uniref:Uncharacterized protein n=1 Tax=Rubripirellula tenax TaxID=2528015 RepID=A0A5C6EGH0_9BACT|nr:hypothetical protein Poly51_48170 [Rubripirellula tenax]